MLVRLLPLFIILMAQLAWAQKLQLPDLKSPVQDEAKILSAEFISEYSNLFRRIYQDGGPQFQVVTVNDLQGHSIEEFTILLAEQWRIGRKGKNDGVIFLMALQERQVRIEVGSDLEGDLTDYESNRIIQDQVLPYFKQGDFTSGVAAGVRSIMQELNLAEVQTSRQFVSPRPVKTGGGFSIFPFILLMFFYPIIRAIFRNRFLTALASGGALSAIYYFLLSYGLLISIMMFFFGFFMGLLGPLQTLMMSSGRHRGGWGGGFGGGGGWSGGGGGFSGGGASGRW